MEKELIIKQYTVNSITVNMVLDEFNAIENW